MQQCQSLYYTTKSASRQSTLYKNVSLKKQTLTKQRTAYKQRSHDKGYDKTEMWTDSNNHVSVTAHSYSTYHKLFVIYGEVLWWKSHRHDWGSFPGTGWHGEKHFYAYCRLTAFTQTFSLSIFEWTTWERYAWLWDTCRESSPLVTD